MQHAQISQSAARGPGRARGCPTSTSRRSCRPSRISTAGGRRARTRWRPRAASSGPPTLTSTPPSMACSAATCPRIRDEAASIPYQGFHILAGFETFTPPSTACSVATCPCTCQCRGCNPTLRGFGVAAKTNPAWTCCALWHTWLGLSFASRQAVSATLPWVCVGSLLKPGRVQRTVLAAHALQKAS